MQQFFYDGQIRRFLLQFTRIFSNFQVEFGQNLAGVSPPDTLYRVPVRYGDSSRNAQTIIQQNSANSMPSTPIMTFYISSLDYDRGRIQEPTFVDKINVRQRYYDTDSDTYEVTQGNAFTIERLMPVPYKLTITLDIWTSNTNQKMQILEQILTLFNPALEIQSTDNYIDWTSLSYVQLTSVTWSSRVVPAGAEEPIDVATLTFTMPIWISAPAKVKRLGVIQKFVGSIYDEQGTLDTDTLLVNLASRRYVTPLDYGVFYSGNQLKLLKKQEVVTESDVVIEVTPPVTWKSLVELYGTLVTGTTEIRLSLPTETELIGTIAYHPTDPHILLFEVFEDTQPLNTLLAVDAIINPQNVKVDSNLLSPAVNTRYLLTNSIGDPGNITGSVVWGDLVANENDIIQYTGAEWQVVFDSNNENTVQYVTNTLTGVQYRWTGVDWVKAVEGVYRGGEWSLII
jgi:hypothetical protein